MDSGVWGLLAGLFLALDGMLGYEELVLALAEVGKV